MKYEKIVLLALIVLLGFITGITGKTVQKEVTKCPRPCKCGPTYKPVCGKSGRTHSNACLSKCFGDVVKHAGPCSLKQCNPKGPVTKTHRCRVKKYGKTGRRKHCCTLLQQNGKTLKKSCQWVGCIHNRVIRRKCTWAKVSKHVTARKCCRWVEKSCGKKKSTGKVVCKYAKKRYYKKRVFGCKLAPFGRNGKRQLCCHHHRVCVNKSCRKVGRKCYFRGGYITKTGQYSCQWKKRCATSKQRKCCKFQKVCRYTAKGRKIGCTKSLKGRCRWTGKRIVRRKRTRCQVRKYGKFGRRKRCCSYHRICNKKTKKCRNANVSCRWTGSAIYKTIVSKCSNKKRGRNCIQRLCCSHTRRCINGRCYNLKRRCSWKGAKRCVRRYRKCNWRKTCKTGRRLQCCVTKKSFNGKRWTSSRKCKWSGKTTYVTYSNKCYWHVLNKHKRYRRRCCVHKKVCKGKLSCKKTKVKCKFIGRVVNYRYSRKCHVKRLSKFARQKVCCSYVHKCHGKSKKCKLFRRKCVKKGSQVLYIPRSKCVRSRYPGRGCYRTRCCKWIKYCVGRKCRPIRRSCRWTGAVTRSYVKTSCSWVVSRNKSTKRRRCCYYKVSCIAKNCKRRKLRCSYTGIVIRTTHHKKCYWKSRGKYVRQKYCCRHTKVTKGGKTSIIRRKCGFVGIRYYRKNFYKCQFKISCKKSLKRRKRCCAYTKSCKGRKCVVHSRKCSWRGPSHKLYHNTVCNFRQYGKSHKRKYCCYLSKKCTFVKRGRHTKKSCKVVKRKCQYHGKKIALRTSYWKKNAYCVKTRKGKFRKCCKRLYLCTKFGNRFVCRLRNSNYQCKYTKIVIKSSICVSSGDPHYTSFNGKKFNFQGRGDYVLVRSRGLTVHTRQKTWSKRTSVNVAIAAKINSRTILESVSRAGNVWLVNKKKVIHLKKGKLVKFAHGGSIKLLTSGRVHIYSRNKDFVDARFYKYKTRNYITVILKINGVTRNIGGLCASSKFTHHGKGLFFKYYKGGKTTKPKKCTGKKRSHAYKVCKKIGVNKKGMSDCILDVCHGLPAGQEKDTEKEVKKVIRKKSYQCKRISSKYDKVAKYISAKSLRARALRRCYHKNKFIFYSCVFDSARGFHKTKKEYIKIAAWTKKHASGYKKCYSSGDPHIKTFASRGFNAYRAQNNRVVYQHGSLKVTTNIRYHSRWGRKGVNHAVTIKSGSKTFTVKAHKGKFMKCSGSLKLKNKRSRSVSTYTFVHGKTTVVAQINIRGYINVYVTAPTLNTFNCKGDCCTKCKKHLTRHGKITYKYGNPYSVRFLSACRRKSKYVSVCRRNRSYSKACACIRKYSNRN